MGGLNVKNTMVERVLQIIAPHPCSGCGKVGSVLCADCKYNITHEPFVGCILCAAAKMDDIPCRSHASPIERSFVVGKRQGVLLDLIDSLKFSRSKAAAFALAELLDDSLPVLPDTTQIIPIPTARSHSRQRGYDQVMLIARHFAHIRGLSVVNALQRTSNATQHTVGRKQRKAQAEVAFRYNPSVALKTNAPVLIIDDIITTGSTVSAAAEVLSKQGTKPWVAALAYQPLD